MEELKTKTSREEQFEQVFNLYFRKIMFYCLHLVRDEAESFDIAQEVFVKAAQEERFLAEGFQVKPWLYKVARNECLMFFREWKKYLSFLNLYRNSEYHEDYLEKNERYEELNKSLDKLPKKLKSILYLKYYEDLSYEEIAEIEQVPVGTVRSRLAYAKEQLKKEIGHD
ncbi:MAG: RNA polymerase sigma factor [Candidatus Wallbacteria bacterium]|nr:RNA polymerase sigma factor [Candidatus Wallbacteria bacterium]